MLDAIRKSNDQQLRALFYKWENNKTMLSKQYSLQKEKRVMDLKNIEDETEDLKRNSTGSQWIFVSNKMQCNHRLGLFSKN